jgi:hypothetical protein
MFEVVARARPHLSRRLDELRDIWDVAAADLGMRQPPPERPNPC